MTGFERLKVMEKEENNPLVTQIVEYLITRDDMQDKYLNEKKTLAGMAEFIEQKVLSLCINNKKKIPNSNTQYAFVGLNDKKVQLWAVMYFSMTDEQLGLNKLKEKISGKAITSITNITKNNESKNTTMQDKTKETKKDLYKAQISLF